MRTLQKLLFATAALFLVGFMVFSPFLGIKSARAQPIAVATSGKLSITLHSEPCALKAVTNLTQRATWMEDGKVSEGCWGPSQFNVIMTFWDDGAVAVVPFEAFRKAADPI